jgi:hypothetical protein
MAVTPSISFAQQAPLIVFSGEARTADVLVRPKVLGICKIRIEVLADECAFRVGNELVKFVEQGFECKDEFSSSVVPVAFTLICTNPSMEDIMINFRATATNSSGGVSVPTPLFRVDVKNRPLILTETTPTPPIS